MGDIVRAWAAVNRGRALTRIPCHRSGGNSPLAANLAKLANVRQLAFALIRRVSCAFRFRADVSAGGVRPWIPAVAVGKFSIVKLLRSALP